LWFFYLLQSKPFSDVISTYVRRTKCRVCDVQFMFDGDVIDPSVSPSDLDMETGDVVDVRERDVVTVR